MVERKYEIMTPVEALRKRPGMYVGDPDYRAFLYILGQVLTQCRELIILTGSGALPPFKDRVPHVMLEVSITDLRVDVAFEWRAPKFEPLPRNIELLFVNYGIGSTPNGFVLANALSSECRFSTAFGTTSESWSFRKGVLERHVTEERTENAETALMGLSYLLESAALRDGLTKDLTLGYLTGIGWNKSQSSNSLKHFE